MVPYWGPPSFPWHDVFGSTDLFHAQNIGQLYAGALVIVAVLGFGIVRGAAVVARGALLRRACWR